MKQIKYFMLGVIAFVLLGAINIKASDLVIKGNSVFRQSATEASISFASNINGDIYYLVNENATASIENIILKVSDADIIINDNGTRTIDIPLSSGAKYAHIVVKDDSNNYSNILNISMPKDVYYFDDFEAYNIDAYPDFFAITPGANGSDTSKQKIINLDGNKVLNAYGTYGRGLEEKILIDPLSSGYAILEADISASTMPTDWYFGGLFIGVDRNVNVLVNNTSKKFAAANYFTGSTFRNKHTSNIDFAINNNYHIKIVVDIENEKFNYYINGTKANLEPVDAGKSFEQLNYFGIYNGDGTIYYDNIKFYSQSTNPSVHSITKGLEENGTIAIDKVSAEKDEIITITPAPELGYRVKSVKINNSESGITNNITNYTFTMPEANVEVMVEFEKIEYDVTSGEGHKHIIGTEKNAVFTIDADRDLFLKAYLDNEELDSIFYTITEGSTIITLKQEFLNNLLPGTYDLKATFSDGGEANTTFAVATSTENNPKTSDSIMLSIILGSISLIGLLCMGFYIKTKKFN